MALKVSHANDVSIYHCTAGRSLPQWEEALAKKEVTGSLRYNEAYRRRLDLLQDFEFKASSGRIHVSDDRQYLGVSGMYGPSCKVYQVEQLGMKFERHLDAEVVQFRFLSEGFRKMAFLRADRTMEIHAQYGKHHTTRIPKFGRDLLYDPWSCDLYVASAGPDVYRLNLEQGRFLAPFTSSSPLSPDRLGSNCLAQSSAHPLLAVGREDGCVECWDPRDRSSAAVLHLAATAAPAHPSPDWADAEVSALAFSLDGLTLACGLSHGRVALYDLRSSRPTTVKDHRYGLPVLSVQWLEGGDTARRLVVSTDAKSIRLWNRLDGTAYAAIESPAALNDCAVWPGSGLVMATGEQQRVQAWYVPALGAAPGWCAFLDSLTEELEERAQTSVYEDYHFVTREQLQDWGCDHLIGTAVLKAYMHGYFVHARLYQRLIAAHAEANPQVQGAVASAASPADTRDRILQRRGGRVAVNSRYAAQLLEQAGVKRRLREEEAEEGKAAVLKNPLGDDRFARMFKEEEFKIDEASDEYRRLHPSHPGQAKGRKRGREEEEEEEEEETKQPAHDDVDEQFERFEDDDDDEEETPLPIYDDAFDDLNGDANDSEEGASEVEAAPAPTRKRRAPDSGLDGDGRRGARAPQMFGLRRGVPLPAVLQPTASQSSIPVAVQRQMTLEERLRSLQAAPPPSSHPRYDAGDADDRRGRGRGGGRGRGRDRGGGEGGEGRERGDRRGMAELLGPERAPVARGKWAERGRGGGRGRGGRGRGGARGSSRGRR